MSWYYGTFTCGHEGRVNIVGPGKDRQWKADRKFEGLCEECYKKKLEQDKEEANKKAMEESKKMDFPELNGTEKQVAWANTIRMNAYNRMVEIVTKFVKEEERNVFLEAIDNYIVSNCSASYWIDQRDKFHYINVDFLKELIRNYSSKSLKTKEVEKETEDKIKQEATVAPIEQKHIGTVEIAITEKEVSAVYEKNEDFREIVKKLGYEWSNGAWRKSIGPRLISSKDRASELGNKLLNAGFAITIQDKETRDNAVNGIYEPEYTHWLTTHNGKLALYWVDKDDSLYKEARKLRTSAWDRPFVTVNVEHYNEVLDFAEINDFGISPRAKQLIVDEIKRAENITKVIPAEVVEAESIDKLKEILMSSTSVLDDLRDDD